jgi:hypothetical protein
MKTGTRRMWGRRFLRAGYFVAPLVTFPYAVWKFFAEDEDDKFCPYQAFFTIIVLSLIGCFFIFIYSEFQNHKDATKQDFAEYMSMNSCMKKHVPEKLEERQRANMTMRVRDLDYAKNECDEAYRLFNQQRAVEELK